MQANKKEGHMPVTLVNPLNETLLEAALAAPRLGGLKGKTIALLDISKPGGGVFLDRIEQLLRERHGVAGVDSGMESAGAKPGPAGAVCESPGAGRVVRA